MVGSTPFTVNIGKIDYIFNVYTLKFRSEKKYTNAIKQEEIKPR